MAWCGMRSATNRFDYRELIKIVVTELIVIKHDVGPDKIGNLYIYD